MNRNLVLVFLVCMLLAFNRYECEAQNSKSYGKWQLVEQVDEFGDPLGESILYYETKGTFSNTTIANKNSVTVQILFTKGYGVYMQFIEYGKYYASLYTDINTPLSVKTQSGKVTKFLMVPRSEGRIFPLAISDVTRKWGYEDFALFIDMIKKETTVRCHFYDQNKQSYSFKIDCRGFTKAYDAFLKDNSIQAVKIFDSDFLYDIGD